VFVGVGVGLTLAILCALRNPCCTSATFAPCSRHAACNMQRAPLQHTPMPLRCNVQQTGQDNQRGSDALSCSAQSLPSVQQCDRPQPLSQTALSESFAVRQTSRPTAVFPTYSERVRRRTISGPSAAVKAAFPSFWPCVSVWTASSVYSRLTVPILCVYIARQTYTGRLPTRCD
jgi:hypothetical protein